MNVQKGFLLILTAALAVVTWLMIKPLLGYVLGAVILAFLLRPLQIKLSPYLGSSATAGLLMLFGIVVLILPVMLASAAVIQDATELSQDINQTGNFNTTLIEQSIQEYTGQEVDIENALSNTLDRFTSTVFGSFSQIVNVIVSIGIGLTLMLFVIYYLLKDGEKFVSWLKDITPLPVEIQDGLHERINKTTWAVIKGHVAVAVAQGLIAGAGLVVAGVPNYIFWTFIMVILAFLPMIGTIIIWGPAAIYLFAIGEVNSAIFLAIYGIVVVGLTDNIMRPLVVDKGADLHPAVIIIGVIGGVYLFGAPGLFIGPIILGIFKSVLLVFKNNYSEL